MFHSTIGLVHLSSALLAMLFGAVVLLNTKGSLFHKRAGYLYVASMLIMNASAFLIYRLFGGFGPFHVAAIISSVSLIGGLVPVLFRRRIQGWLHFHYHFMNWSVVGLYAAFWSETLTRTLPMAQFWPVVAGATGATVFAGAYLIRRNAARFLKKKTGEKETLGVQSEA